MDQVSESAAPTMGALEAYHEPNALEATKTYVYNLYAHLGFDWRALTNEQHEAMAKAVLRTAFDVTLATSRK